MLTAVRPVPRSIAGSASPISPVLSPRFSVSPCPSRPGYGNWLEPQHFTLPSSNITQEPTSPVSILTAVRPVPRSIAGSASPISPVLSPRSSVSPCPSCPAQFTPQHLTLPLSRIAHEWSPPAAILTAESSVPRSIAGRASPISPGSSPRCSVSPSPSWPSALAPQHFTQPSSNSAQAR
eukprot:2454324-Rhodomonas_salina.1